MWKPSCLSFLSCLCLDSHQNKRRDPRFFDWSQCLGRGARRIPWRGHWQWGWYYPQPPSGGDKLHKEGICYIHKKVHEDVSVTADCLFYGGWIRQISIMYWCNRGDKCHSISMSSVLEYLEKNNPDRVNSFKSAAQEAIKKITSDIDNYQVAVEFIRNPFLILWSQGFCRFHQS